MDSRQKFDHISKSEKMLRLLACVVEFRKSILMQLICHYRSIQLLLCVWVYRRNGRVSRNISTFLLQRNDLFKPIQIRPSKFEIV
jgi:hypothetical protein